LGKERGLLACNVIMHIRVKKAWGFSQTENARQASQHGGKGGNRNAKKDPLHKHRRGILRAMAVKSENQIKKCQGVKERRGPPQATHSAKIKRSPQLSQKKTEKVRGTLIHERNLRGEDHGSLSHQRPRWGGAGKPTSGQDVVGDQGRRREERPIGGSSTAKRRKDGLGHKTKPRRNPAGKKKIRTQAKLI